MNTNEQPEQETVRELTVLICGGRRWNYREMTFRKLDALHKKLQFTHVIHGAASGADTLGGLWAKSRGMPVTEYPANWQACPTTRPGPIEEAGFKRNQQMLDTGKPDLIIAFPGTGGTADMMRRSREGRRTSHQPTRHSGKLEILYRDGAQIRPIPISTTQWHIRETHTRMGPKKAPSFIRTKPRGKPAAMTLPTNLWTWTRSKSPKAPEALHLKGPPAKPDRRHIPDRPTREPLDAHPDRSGRRVGKAPPQPTQHIPKPRRNHDSRQGTYRSSSSTSRGDRQA